MPSWRWDSDLILLDNMGPATLRKAVARRECAAGRRLNWRHPAASILATVRGVAETGVERISVGALTHSAVSLDFGLDWK